MANVTCGDQTIEIQDNSPLQIAGNALGIVFGCRNGMCGTCEIEVIEGMENLSERNEAEKMLAPESNKRLCCQAEIKTGNVTIQQ